MYNKGWVIPGIIILLALMVWPFVVAGASFVGKPVPTPDLPKPAQYLTDLSGKSLERVKANLDENGNPKCIRSKDEMRASHMKLLEKFRNDYVRDGLHDPNGNESIKGCRDCHPKREEFCNRCHDYMSVKPECWECHYYPKQPEPGEEWT